MSAGWSKAGVPTQHQAGGLTADFTSASIVSIHMEARMPYPNPTSSPTVALSGFPCKGLCA